MTDILETIDRLYAKAEKANTGGPAAAYEAAMLELHSALVGNWPAVRDRLREAERKASDVNDELKSVLADWNEVRSASGSKTNGGLVGHITELRRKAKAFDLENRVIDEIDKLHAEATPGPWQWSDAHDDRDGGRTWSLIGGGGYGILSCDGEWNSPQRCNPNDADLIAVLRNNWPALRDRLREAERKAKDNSDELDLLRQFRSLAFSRDEAWLSCVCGSSQFYRGTKDKNALDIMSRLDKLNEVEQKIRAIEQATREAQP